MLMYTSITIGYKPLFRKMKYHKIRFQYTIPEGSDVEPYRTMAYRIYISKNPIPFKRIDEIKEFTVERELKYINADIFIDLKNEIIVKDLTP